MYPWGRRGGGGGERGEGLCAPPNWFTFTYLLAGLTIVVIISVSVLVGATILLCGAVYLRMYATSHLRASETNHRIIPASTGIPNWFMKKSRNLLKGYFKSKLQMPRLESFWGILFNLIIITGAHYNNYRLFYRPMSNL